MGIVTKVEVQKRHKDRVNIYVDDEFCCGLNMEAAMSHGVKKGAEFLPNEIVDIMLDSDKMTALSKACDFISKTPKTEKQIRDYLQGKGYDDIVIDSVIAKMKEYKYIDDNEYARLYLSSISGVGKTKIKYNLLKRGIDKDTIESVLDGYQSDKDEIEKIARKYLKGKECTKENIAKLYRHLVGKGFDYEEIRSIIGNIRIEDYDDRD